MNRNHGFFLLAAVLLASALAMISGGQDGEDAGTTAGRRSAGFDPKKYGYTEEDIKALREQWLKKQEAGNTTAIHSKNKVELSQEEIDAQFDKYRRKRDAGQTVPPIVPTPAEQRLATQARNLVNNPNPKPAPRSVTALLLGGLGLGLAGYAYLRHRRLKVEKARARADRE